MKKIIIYITVVLSLWQCTLEDFDPQTWAIDPILDISESGLLFYASENQKKISCTSNYKTIDISSSEDWCTAEYANDTLTVSVSPNPSVGHRLAEISVTISMGDKSLKRNISIVQMGGNGEVIGNFQVLWTYEVSETQKDIISELLSNMVYVYGGTFMMGSQNTDPGEVNYVPFLDQNNLKRINIGDYFISKYEIRQKEWRAIMGKTYCLNIGEDLPVDYVLWEEAMDFTQKLSDLTGLVVTLPTESQWEYAARGGRYSKGYLYSGSDDLGKVAHTAPESLKENLNLYKTAPVGSLEPNELGIYDMSGNVAEYCAHYDDSDSLHGFNNMILYVTRGGSFNDDSSKNCVFARDFRKDYTSYTGFRIVIKPTDYE